MQMIDVLKRLAELDATNPNVVPAKKMVKENADLAECGIMPEISMMGGTPERPPMPASINMTAGSGDELSNMLATIMQLAGVHQVEPSHMGMDHNPMTLTAEPAMTAGPAASDGEIMRGVIDKMNPEMGGDDVNTAHGDFDNDGDHDMADHEAEKETDEGQYSDGHTDPRKPPPFNANQFAHQENQPGQGDRMDGTMPKATMEQQLMADYKKFVAEGEDSNEIGPGWKTEHGIVDQVDGNSVIVKTSQGKMRVNINDIKTAEAPKEGNPKGESIGQEYEEGVLDTVKSAVGLGKKPPATTAEKNAAFHAANKGRNMPSSGNTSVDHDRFTGREK